MRSLRYLGSAYLTGMKSLLPLFHGGGWETLEKEVGKVRRWEEGKLGGWEGGRMMGEGRGEMDEKR